MMIMMKAFCKKKKEREVKLYKISPKNKDKIKVFFLNEPKFVAELSFFFSFFLPHWSSMTLDFRP